jgi:hypothetical protein
VRRVALSNPSIRFVVRDGGKRIVLRIVPFVGYVFSPHFTPYCEVSQAVSKLWSGPIGDIFRSIIISLTGYLLTLIGVHGLERMALQDLQ